MSIRESELFPIYLFYIYIYVIFWAAIFLGTARAISCLSIDSSGTEAEAFQAKRPTFQTILDQTAVRNAYAAAGLRVCMGLQHQRGARDDRHA